MGHRARPYKPISQWNKRDREVDVNGYVRVKVPEHPRAFRGGWVYEHRLVAEMLLGRLLEIWETVHHIDEIKTHNHPDNLVVCIREEHDRAHRFAHVVA